VFQSLTGSIQTAKYNQVFGKYLVSIPHRFNSNLIISWLKLKTFYRFNPSQVQFKQKDGRVVDVLDIEFQSLTGSIQTCWGRQNSGSGSLVSIPHRFNSNRSYINGSILVMQVSIPHRFNSNEKGHRTPPLT